MNDENITIICSDCIENLKKLRIVTAYCYACKFFVRYGPLRVNTLSKCSLKMEKKGYFLIHETDSEYVIKPQGYRLIKYAALPGLQVHSFCIKPDSHAKELYCDDAWSIG